MALKRVWARGYGAFCYLGVVYSIVMVGLVFAGRIWENVFPLFDGLMLIPQVLLLGSLPLLIISLPSRQKTLIVHMIPIAMLIVHYRYAYLPKQVPAQLSLVTFTLLSNNIGATDYVAHPQAIQVIDAAQADVVVLQEVHPQVYEALIQRYQAQYPYQAYLKNSWLSLFGREVGFVVLSRFKLTPVLDQSSEQGFMRVEFHLDEDHTIMLYCVHLLSIRATQWQASTRTQQLQILLQTARQETLPVVLAGDFNLTDWSASYAQLAAEYRDAFRDNGSGLSFTGIDTYPSGRAGSIRAFFYDLRRMEILPLFTRIDYVFQSAQLAIYQAQVWPQSSGSDHRAVFVKLGFGRD